MWYFETYMIVTLCDDGYMDNMWNYAMMDELVIMDGGM